MNVVIAFKSKRNTKKIAKVMGDALHTTPSSTDLQQAVKFAMSFIKGGASV